MQNLRQGYTLIELLIVVAIIAIFSGILLAYLNVYTDDRKIEGEAKRLVDFLELAKKKASAGDIVQACSGTSFTGYKVTVTTNGYSLSQCCDVSCAAPYSISGASYTFPTNVISILDSTVGNVVFSPLAAGATTTLPSNTATLKSLSAKCLDVTVNVAGLITLGAIYTGC